MSEQPEALRLADALSRNCYDESLTPLQAAAELRRLQGLIDACAIYLKEGETPADRILRERGDTDAVCRLYAKEREKNQELLEALKLMLAVETVFDAEVAEDAARAAIAKAEGEKHGTR